MRDFLVAFVAWVATFAVLLFIVGSLGWVGPVEFLLLGLASIVLVAVVRRRRRANA